MERQPFLTLKTHLSREQLAIGDEVLADFGGDIGPIRAEIVELYSDSARVRAKNGTEERDHVPYSGLYQVS